ncbi:hypothetical protein JCM11251_000793 [Rhodosporidiobolus azoricus]
MSDAAAAAAAQAAAYKAMQHTAAHSLIGPVIIGAFLGHCMCGGVVALAALYAMRYPRDRWPFKALVGFLTLFTVYDTAVEAAWVWRWAIEGFTDLTILGDITPVYFSLSAMNIGIAVLFVQSFFIWRVWVISNRKSLVLCAVQLTLMLLAVSSVMVVSAKGYTSATNDEISVFRPIAILRLAAGVSADCVITGSLVYYIIIRPRATGMPEYSSSLQRIVAQAFTTNLVTGIVQMTVLILLAADMTSMRFTIPSFLEVKTMVMCLLATLLSRPATSSGYSTSGDPSSDGFTSGATHNNTKYNTRSRTNHGNSVRVDIDTHVDIDHDLDMPGSVEAVKSPYRVTFTGTERELNEKAGGREEDMELKEF